MPKLNEPEDKLSYEKKAEFFDKLSKLLKEFDVQIEAVESFTDKDLQVDFNFPGGDFYNFPMDNGYVNDENAMEMSEDLLQSAINEEVEKD